MGLRLLAVLLLLTGCGAEHRVEGCRIDGWKITCPLHGEVALD